MNQREQYKRMIKFSSSVLIIAVQVWIYWQVWMRYYSSNIELPFFRKGNWLMAALYGAMLLFFVHTYGGLKVGYLRKGDLIYSQMLGTVFVNAVTYVQICLLDRHFVNAVPLLVMSVLQGIVFFFVGEFVPVDLQPYVPTTPHDSHIWRTAGLWFETEDQYPGR